MRDSIRNSLRAVFTGDFYSDVNSAVLNHTMYINGVEVIRFDKERQMLYIKGEYPGQNPPGSETLKQRLNQIPLFQIRQRDKRWYLNGGQWTGDKLGIQCPDVDVRKVGIHLGYGVRITESA